jgi:CDP-diacylglycerol--glycerol-3-phosphate 3-phosphatidyltransferase
VRFSEADERVAYGSLKERVREFLKPLARLFADLGVSPAALTIAGLVFSVFAAISLGTGRFFGAALLLIVAGLCDMVDGAAARAGKRASSRGAFLDSTVDRYSDTVVLLGAMHYYLVRSPSHPEELTAVVVLVALAGSMLTSYTRARAEAIGQECKVGIAERPERMILVILGSLFGPNTLRIALWILAIASHVTAVQRMRHVLLRVR